MEEDYDYLIKFVLLGDMKTGKTNLMLRFTENRFVENHKVTLGVDCRTKNVEIDGKKIKAQVWDTSGQERFRAVCSSYYRGALAALLVYDITNAYTFDNLHHWLCALKEQNTDKNLVIILVGNKTDLRHLRAISVDEGVQFAKDNGLLFIETSALNADNVETAFEQVLSEVCKHKISNPYSNEEDHKTIKLGETNEESKSGCFERVKRFFNCK